MGNSIKGFILLLSAGFFYSLLGVFSRFIGTSLDAFFQLWTRALIALFVVACIILITKTKLIKVSRNKASWVFLVGLSNGLLLSPFFIAINHIAIGTTLFLFYASTTISSYILSIFLLKEQLTKIKAVSLTLALLGLVFMYMDTIKVGDPIYFVLASVSGVFFGTYLVAVRRLQGHFPSLQISLFNLVGAFIVNLFISLLLIETWSFDFATPFWFANIALALCLLAGSLAAIYGFRYIDVQKGSLTLLSEIVFGVLIGVFLYNEIPNFQVLLGSLLVFMSLVLPNVFDIDNGRLVFTLSNYKR